MVDRKSNYVVVDELSPSFPKMLNPQAKTSSTLQSQLQRVQIQTLSGVSCEVVDTETGKTYDSLDAALTDRSSCAN